ncbi:MAG: hypothetical protein KC643_24345, partial [Nitrospira sp.]|nr:hypothetical protein [Nitrospira sp.]
DDDEAEVGLSCISASIRQDRLSIKHKRRSTPDSIVAPNRFDADVELIRKQEGRPFGFLHKIDITTM